LQAAGTPGTQNEERDGLYHQPPFLAASPNYRRQKKIAAEDYLEILCHNQVLSPNDDLAAIKSFVWKKGGDMELFYRRKKEWQTSKLKT